MLPEFLKFYKNFISGLLPHGKQSPLLGRKLADFPRHRQSNLDPSRAGAETFQPSPRVRSRGRTSLSPPSNREASYPEPAVVASRRTTLGTPGRGSSLQGSIVPGPGTRPPAFRRFTLRRPGSETRMKTSRGSHGE